nr:hypothetical protein AUSP0033_00022 [uncultured phage]
MKALTKSSSNTEIKQYFSAVFNLSKSDQEFPVNLDEVWPLVYSRKQEAVRALTNENSEFVEGIDFQAMRRNAQGGQFATTDYFLSLSCMEFFIARKVRPVFDVYRKVFHHTAKRKPSSLREKITAANWMAKFLNLNDSSRLSLVQSIVEPLGLPVPNYTPSKGVLKAATVLLKESGATMTAHTFNLLMINKGYMTEIERPSKTKGVKRFKSIVGEGLKYGENQVSPNNPKETQPLYYVDKFDELLSLLK